jgi:hypothetical protein
MGAETEAAGALTMAAAAFSSSLSNHMPSRIIISFFILAALPLQAAPRPWRSPDGQRSVQGEFIKRDVSSVTIRREDQKEVIIPFDQLHQDDRTWIDANHPLPKIETSTENQVFDELCFGDSRAVVLAKLKASQIVEMTVDEVHIGRTGLNDIFRTRKKIGGLDASLFFDWTEEGGLNEISLQTTTVPAAKFNEQLQPCWKEFIKLLTSLHGQPISGASGLRLTSIPDGGMMPTHMWKLQKTGSAMLGAARDGDQYQLVVRFTRKSIQPVEITIPGSR